ncbi:SadB/YajI family lipoprotein [Erwinia tasmaniensis]|uniref:Lipoprotein n=1 Tax=Erwinia tasmaniensis (strain DSM 17950 / CFBP 7177 / CIP 109463 / NCPPB 4357 / Et1/99) TaxID=465817 RepID=B2VHQ3_ERWT9|nr:DUF3251 domain-containing protein [Erwinia tasmaniensis]CAO97581.1 Putative lipoprotein [Erwinia tasmaniensis Et1/99]
MITLRVGAMSAALLLSGCLSSPPDRQTQRLHHQVSRLSQELGHLTLQATAIERQSLLNQNSLQGAWLVPAAKTPVLLQSQAGQLRLWLSNITRQDGGTCALLHLSVADAARLAALTGRVEWGSLDESSGRPLSAQSRSETFRLEPALPPPREAGVMLYLQGFPPEKLGYVRVHGLMLIGSSAFAP